MERLRIIPENDSELFLVHGDIGESRAEGIVNAWNRNFIPYWLLIPQGVSKSLKKHGGAAPFKELRKKGLLGLGEAVATSAGELEAQTIIHAAALHAYWRASEKSVELAARNSFALAAEMGLKELAIPLLGAGTGGLSEEKSFALIVKAWEEFSDRGPSRTDIYVFGEEAFGRLKASCC